VELRSVVVVDSLELRSVVFAVVVDSVELRSVVFVVVVDSVELTSVVVVVDSVELNDDNTQTFMTALKANVKQGCKFVLCVLPSNRKDRYDAIKVYLCCDNPVPSQMILDRTLGKRNMLISVATKVAIQINCKMGGEVWKLQIPVSTSAPLSLSVDAYRLAERSWVFNLSALVPMLSLTVHSNDIRIQWIGQSRGSM